MLVERGPGAKVIPSEARRDAIDVLLTFAFRRARLQHGVVNTDVLAPGIELRECLVEGPSPVARDYLFQQRRCVRQMLAKRISQGLRAPDEHPAVPEEIAGFNELLRHLDGRLLSEATDLENAILRLIADLDVAVPGFCASGRDADHNDVFASGCYLRCAFDVFAKALLVRDYVIGRKHSNHGRWVTPLQQKRRQADRRSRVSSYGFGNDLLLVQTLELPRDCVAKISIRDDPELLRIRQRQKTLDGLLNHAFLAVERQQLLGHAFAAQRPEARAPTTGKNHGIESKLA